MIKHEYVENSCVFLCISLRKSRAKNTEIKKQMHYEFSLSTKFKIDSSKILLEIKIKS